MVRDVLSTPIGERRGIARELQRKAREVLWMLWIRLVRFAKDYSLWTPRFRLHGDAQAESTDECACETCHALLAGGCLEGG